MGILMRGKGRKSGYSYLILYNITYIVDSLVPVLSKAPHGLSEIKRAELQPENYFHPKWHTTQLMEKC